MPDIDQNLAFRIRFETVSAIVDKVRQIAKANGSASDVFDWLLASQLSLSDGPKPKRARPSRAKSNGAPEPSLLGEPNDSH